MHVVVLGAHFGSLRTKCNWTCTSWHTKTKLTLNDLINKVLCSNLLATSKHAPKTYLILIEGVKYAKQSTPDQKSDILYHFLMNMCFLWCPFLDPHLTRHHSQKCTWLRLLIRPAYLDYEEVPKAWKCLLDSDIVSVHFLTTRWSVVRIWLILSVQ